MYWLIHFENNSDVMAEYFCYLSYLWLFLIWINEGFLCCVIFYLLYQTCWSGVHSCQDFREYDNFNKLDKANTKSHNYRYSIYLIRFDLHFKDSTLIDTNWVSASLIDDPTLYYAIIVTLRNMNNCFTVKFH